MYFIVHLIWTLNEDHSGNCKLMQGGPYKGKVKEKLKI